MLSRYQMRNKQVLVQFVLAISICILSGCGGGGKSNSLIPGGTPSGAGQQQANASTSTTFIVNAQTGQVIVKPPPAGASGALRTNAAFSGTGVTFTSSTLLDQPGDTGVKSLSVSLTNNWGVPIGVLPDGTATGLNVQFSAFTNLSAFPTGINQLTNVTTYAGSGSSGSANGYLTSASFDFPAGIACDANGVIYVADGSNNMIRKITHGVVSTLAGSGSAGGANGSGSAATFSDPTGIAYNPVDQALYVTEFNGYRVRRVTLNGSVSTVAGTGSSGETGGAGNVATFNVPSGIAIDSSGNLYVVDNSGNTIRMITLSGSPTSPANWNVTTIAGSGSSGSSDGQGTSATFNGPRGIAIDTSGILYVADAGNNLIRRIDSAFNVTTIAGNGTAAELDGVGGSAELNGPVGIATYNGSLFVVDRNGDTVRQLTLIGGTSAPSNSNSWEVTTIAGTGSSGSNNGTGNNATFNTPLGIMADQAGNLLVADKANNLIREVSPANGFFPIGIVSGTPPSEPVRLSNATGVVAAGSAPYITYPGSVAAGATSSAQNWNFIIPSGVTAFEFTVTVVADSSILAPPGAASGSGSANVTVQTAAGSASGFKDGAGTLALFAGPKFAAADANGNVYVSDPSNYAIRRISPTGQVTTIAGVVGTGQGSTDGPGNTASLYGPTGIAVDPTGSNVYFGDGDAVRCASITAGADPTQSANWYVATIAGTAATAGFLGGPGTSAGFDAVSGCALDNSGNVYVAESTGNRVRQVQFRGGDPTLAADWQVNYLAGNTASMAPTGGDSNGTGSSASFNGPQGIATDASGNVYVADTSNDLVRAITPAGVVTTLAGTATTAGYNDATGTSAKFNAPKGIAVDSSGYIYVSDYSGYYIRRVSPGGVVETVAGNGTQGTTNGVGSSAEFYNPYGLAITPSGNLYVCDTAGDYAVREILRVVNLGVDNASARQH